MDELTFDTKPYQGEGDKGVHPLVPPMNRGQSEEGFTQKVLPEGLTLKGIGC